MKNTTSSINEGELESQNPQVKWYIITFLSLLYGTISVVSVIGNGLIIYTVAANKKIQFIINIFICNLAVSDIIIGKVLVKNDVYIIFVKILSIKRCSSCTFPISDSTVTKMVRNN